jgi:hypothetical protein
MDFILTSSPKYTSLSLVERSQLDLLKILDKAGVSLQIQDKIIDWAYHYSLANKIHNNVHDFWIRRNFLGRDVFSKTNGWKSCNHRPQTIEQHKYCTYDLVSLSINVY